MKKIFILIILTGMMFYSCKKIATSDLPPNQLTEGAIFSDTTSISAATAGLFTDLGTVDANLYNNIGLYTDELKTTSATASDVEFANSSLTVANSSVLAAWQNLYKTIYKSNSLISGIEKSTSISGQSKNNALGESKFIRGYCYLLLERLFGDVPLILGTNTQTNAIAPKSDSKTILNQVISDFNSAQLLMTANYPLNNGKTTANKFAALAYLSQACLEDAQYTRADSAASVIIASGQYRLLSDLTKICTKDNDEAIFQLWNQDGISALNLVADSGVPTYQISSSLLSAFSSGDLRKSAWIGSNNVLGLSYYFPLKYRQSTSTTGAEGEYDTFMRLDEVYLIRSEARARVGNLTEAQADLNVIRNRAGLGPTPSTTKSDLLTAILQERQLELFNENGSRFFDLKRFGLLDQTLIPMKHLWKSTGSVFPIPQTEILNDPNLTQNAGY
jgi:hypothetical protein